MIIYSTRYASVDSGHEDDMDDDTNQEEFPDVCLFSVAMMMMEKVIIYIRVYFWERQSFLKYQI